MGRLAVIASAAMFGVRWVEALWQLYAFHILFGAGYAACALLPCTTLVARWFNEKRSIALSYASTGLSVGGILLTPLSAKLIDIGGIGWAAQWLALIFFIGIVPVSLLVFRPSPASMGLRPDGAAVSRDEKGNALPEAAAEGADFGGFQPCRAFRTHRLTYITHPGELGACAMRANEGPMESCRNDAPRATTRGGAVTASMELTL